MATVQSWTLWAHSALHGDHTSLPAWNVANSRYQWLLNLEGGDVNSYTTSSWSAAGLPAGMSVDSWIGADGRAGRVVGVPQGDGDYAFTATAHTNLGDVSGTCTWRVAGSPCVIASTASWSGSRGAAFLQGLSVLSYGTPTWAYTGTLPTGLSINTSTGEVHGTPTETGTFNGTITVTNEDGSDTCAVSITIATTPPVLPGTQSISGQVTVSLPYSLTNSGGAATSWGLTGTLPIGMAFNTTTGALSGTPLINGTYNLSISATNEDGTSTCAVTLTVVPSVVNRVFSNTSAAGNYPAPSSDGTGYEAWTNPIVNPFPSVPTRVHFFGTVDSSLLIKTTSSPSEVVHYEENTASTAVDFYFDQDIGDSFYLYVWPKYVPPAGTPTNTWAINATAAISYRPPAIVPGQTYNAPTGHVFAHQVVVSNATPTKWYAPSLPPGLALNTTTGVIYGTPTTLGSYTVAVTAANSGGGDTRDVTIVVIAPPPLPEVTGPLWVAQKGTLFSGYISATGYPTSYGASNLPIGLSLDTTTGVVSGTPTTAGTNTVVLTASNVTGSASTTISFVVVGTPAEHWLVAGAAVYIDQTDFAAALASVTPVWTATGLPPGLIVDAATGNIHGTPTTAGHYSVACHAVWDAGTVSCSYPFVVVAAGTNTGDRTLLTNPTSGNGWDATSYNFYAAEATSEAFVGWSAQGMPAGMRMQPATGLVTGKPLYAGTYSVVLTRHAIGIANQTTTLTWTVLGAPRPHAASWSWVQSMSGQTWSGEDTHYFFMPVGYDPELEVPKIAGRTRRAHLVATISGGAALQVVAFPTMTNRLYRSTSTSQDAYFDMSAPDRGMFLELVPPFSPLLNQGGGGTWPVLLGDRLHCTINTDANGDITSIPWWELLTGTYVVMPGTNANLSWSVNATLTVDYAHTASALTVGAAYTLTAGTAMSQAIAYTGDAPSSWAATNLPPGLTINNLTGVISGTPLAVGSSLSSYSRYATVEAICGDYTVSYLVVNITVNVPASLRSGTTSRWLAANVAASITPADIAAVTTFAAADVTWVATGLPTGLTMDATTGVISGTPTTPGTYTAAYTGTWAAGAATVVCTFIVPAPPAGSIADAQTLTGVVGEDFNELVGTTGTVANWTATGLPPGLWIDPTTGVIAGTPTTSGSFKVLVQADVDVTAASPTKAGNGAAGRQSVVTVGGELAFYGAGGGGALHCGLIGTRGLGGLGGGGDGGYQGALSGDPIATTSGTAGIPGTGSGGGGGMQNQWNTGLARGGQGGSGIVVLRMPIGVPPPSIEYMSDAAAWVPISTATLDAAELRLVDSEYQLYKLRCGYAGNGLSSNYFGYRITNQSSSPFYMDILLVGGGGGGGGYYAGGGGGGGEVVEALGVTIPGTVGATYVAFVGRGGFGTGQPPYPNGDKPEHGFASSFGSSLYAAGGGGGATQYVVGHPSTSMAYSGGSGGGGTVDAGAFASSFPNRFPGHLDGAQNNMERTVRTVLARYTEGGHVGLSFNTTYIATWGYYCIPRPTPLVVSPTTHKLTGWYITSPYGETGILKFACSLKASNSGGTTTASGLLELRRS